MPNFYQRTHSAAKAGFDLAWFDEAAAIEASVLSNLSRKTMGRQDGAERQGSVKWFNEKKGYGFLVPDSGGQDVFLHIVQLERNAVGPVATGDRLAFQVKSTPKGDQAMRLRRL